MLVLKWTPQSFEMFHIYIFCTNQVSSNSEIYFAINNSEFKCVATKMSDKHTIDKVLLNTAIVPQ